MNTILIKIVKSGKRFISDDSDMFLFSVCVHIFLGILLSLMGALQLKPFKKTNYEIILIEMSGMGGAGSANVADVKIPGAEKPAVQKAETNIAKIDEFMLEVELSRKIAMTMPEKGGGSSVTGNGTGSGSGKG